MKTELVFSYDSMMRPTSAKCRLCGQMMPKPGTELNSSADIVLWVSERFLEHKRLEHPGEGPAQSFFL
ncbi:MAG: hypothetical protein JST28_22660 [Acidobacteria bacterium]|nr:hypothetical protein [Acidobacteriota bacterium]